MKLSPAQDEYVRLAAEYNVIPLYAEIRGDLYTTISLFMKLREGKYQFLLESAVSGEFFGRFSFMGSSDRAIVCKDGNVSLMEGNRITGGGTYDNPLHFVREFFGKMMPFRNPALPPFVNGVVGYIGYDTVKYFERVPSIPRDDLRLNDFELIIAESMIVYDHLLHKLYLVSSPRIEDGENPADAYLRGAREIERMAALIDSSPAETPMLRVATESGKIQFRSNFSKERYEKAVESVKGHIHDGDIFQLVLSQRLRIPVQGDPFHLYRSLRVVNPSPYMFYLKCSDVEIIGSSPEIHVQLNDGRVTLRPIAGTRPRGKSVEEDRLLEEELLADEKERAEHIMLVDLGRNDAGRVCQGGSVRVDDLMGVEYYSHVMHIVSNVVGKLSAEYDPFDLLESTFPAGTVSGAPKIRAMELISRYEPDRRGIYSGVVGYCTYDQNLDTCIAIRTFIVKNGTVYLQAGAGIVADSNPEKEYYETIHKMRALSRALELLEEMK